MVVERMEEALSRLPSKLGSELSRLKGEHNELHTSHGRWKHADFSRKLIFRPHLPGPGAGKTGHETLGIE